MIKIIFIGLLASIFALASIYFFKNKAFSNGAPPYEIEDLDPPNSDPYAWITDWVREPGPPRVGLQVGHYKNDELPEELSRLRGNTGATGGGKTEAEVNFEIANLTAELLRAEGIQVDILPATVPARYWADVFIAIHADGSTDRNASGFKIAAPRHDYSGKAQKLSKIISNTYQQETKLTIDPNVSRNMTGYYAFAWWRYEHAVHPRSTSVILETGFLTNASDRLIIVSRPDISAVGLSIGIIQYLKEEKLLN